MIFNKLKDSNWLRYVVTLIIGGLLVAFGYLIGDSAPNVEAQDGISKFDDTIYCKKLLVTDGISVSDGNAVIDIAIVEGEPGIFITEQVDEKENTVKGAHLTLAVEKKKAVLRLSSEYDNGGHIGLSSGKGAAVMLIKTRDRMDKDDGITLTTGTPGSLIMFEGKLVESEVR